MRDINIIIRLSLTSSRSHAPLGCARPANPRFSERWNVFTWLSQGFLESQSGWILHLSRQAQPFILSVRIRDEVRTQWKNVTSGKCCLYSTKGLYFKSLISNWYTLTQKPSIETRRVTGILRKTSGIFPFNSNELNKCWHLLHFPLWAPLLGLGTDGITKTVVHSGGTVRTNWLENLH